MTPSDRLLRLLSKACKTFSHATLDEKPLNWAIKDVDLVMQAAPCEVGLLYQYVRVGATFSFRVGAQLLAITLSYSPTKDTFVASMSGATIFTSSDPGLDSQLRSYVTNVFDALVAEDKKREEKEG